MIEVSRIVTIYNQWQFLDWLEDERLFDAQTEFIVVDDGSAEPAPPELAARLSARGIELVRLPRNSGRCVARNTGAQLARGHWIDFIDGDDRPLPLVVRPEWDAADVVFFTFDVHGAATDMRRSWVRHPALADPQSPEGFIDPRPAAVLWRREAFLAAGAFDPRFEYAEDVDLLLRTRSLRRAYSRTPKQSYNEQPRTDYTEIAAAAARLLVHRRLPAAEAQRDELIRGDLRALHLQVTWRLLRSGERKFLFRSCLALLRNLLKRG